MGLSRSFFHWREKNPSRRSHSHLISLHHGEALSFLSLPTMKQRNEDRISQLPEPLLLNILSSLPAKDVVATSALSRQWKSLWKLVPKLVFDDYQVECEFIEPENSAYSQIVCKVLLSNIAPVLESLHVSFKLENCDATDIGMMIGMAYARGVRHLYITVGSERGCFKFPKSLYYCETLESLELCAWILIELPAQACFNSLRSLCVRSADFADDKSLVNLLSGCPNLENLEVHRGDVSMVVFTIEVPSLQRLTIVDGDDAGDTEGYLIKAPSLKYLKIKEFKGLEYCLIENTPELVEAHIVNVSEINNENILESITSVKRLSLVLSPLEITFPTGSIFKRLVNLELSTSKVEWWNLLLLILDCSPKLQVLKLNDSRGFLSKHWRKEKHVGYGKWSQPKNVPECLLLTLEKIVWVSYKYCLEEEAEVAKYILGNAKHLKRATFSAKPFNDFNSQEMVEQLQSVVRASNSCQLVFK